MKWWLLKRRQAKTSRHCDVSPGDQAFYLVGINGFGQVMIESRLHRRSPVIILSPPGESNQLEIRCPGFLSQRASDLIAAQIRHPNVEERYIRTKGLRQRQGCLTQMRDSYVVA